MQIRHVMTANVHTVTADQKLLAADELMHSLRVRHLPVVDRQGHLVGILSDRDVLRASVSAIETRIANYERRQHLTQVTTGDVMSSPTHVAAPETTVRQAAATMRTFHIDCLPVVDHGRLMGIVTTYDLLGLVVHLPDDPIATVATSHHAGA